MFLKDWYNGRHLLYPRSMPVLFSLYCVSLVNARLIFPVLCIPGQCRAYFLDTVYPWSIPGHIFLVPCIPGQYRGIFSLYREFPMNTRAYFPCTRNPRSITQGLFSLYIRCIPVHSSTNSPGLIDITPRILSSTTWGSHLHQLSFSTLQDNFKTVYTVHYILYIQCTYSNYSYNIYSYMYSMYVCTEKVTALHKFFAMLVFR